MHEEHVEIVRKIRELRRQKRRAEKKGLIGAWREKDRLNGEIIDSFVIILRTTGCRWAKVSGCSMCGYYNDTSSAIKKEDLKKQIEDALGKYRGEKLVKIYTSGSFLDDAEVPTEIQNEIVDSFSSAERIIVETRPEFVKKKIEWFKSKENIMIALGLESANDETLLFRINKGFLVRHYINAAKLLNEAKIPVKTYALLKPPFMTEREAIEEAIMTIKLATKYSEVVSLNPMNIQSNTLVEYLWQRGEYSPPWLWSIVEVLKRTHELGEIVSYPTAGGTKRGAHNCGKCDEVVVKSIYDFSLHQDISYLANLNCKCRERWEKIVKYGPLFWDYSIEARRE